MHRVVAYEPDEWQTFFSPQTSSPFLLIISFFPLSLSVYLFIFITFIRWSLTVQEGYIGRLVTIKQPQKELKNPKVPNNNKNHEVPGYTKSQHHKSTNPMHSLRTPQNITQKETSIPTVTRVTTLQLLTNKLKEMEWHSGRTEIQEPVMNFSLSINASTSIALLSKHLEFLSFQMIHKIIRKGVFHITFPLIESIRRFHAPNRPKIDRGRTQLQPNHHGTDFQSTWALLQLKRRWSTAT